MELGLALSGGGFRATLFHLGVLRALLDHGSLRDVRHITSVSGGSILAAHLVQHWDDYTRPETFEKPARQIIDFTRSDVRGRIFRRLLLPHNWLRPYVSGFRHWPPRLRRDGTVRNLLFEGHLLRLYGDVLLSDLASSASAPRLDILTTNLNQGSLAYFSNGFLVDNDEKPREVETPITTARAVMASALFPAVFPTVEFNAETLRVGSAQDFPNAQYFTDGGVYDNLGIRRFRTVLGGEGCTIQNVLVSDASGAFDWLIGRETLGLWKTAVRSSEVLMKRMADLECEIAGGRGSSRFRFLRISDVVDDAALPETVQQQIKQVRTDLDRFSVPEIRALVMHGYEVAALAIGGDPKKAWDPFPTSKPEPEQRLVDRMRRARFRPWGLFNRRDWSSYVYPGLFVIALLFAYDWYRGERLHREYQQQFAMSGEVPAISDVQHASALVKRAVKRPHRDQTHRLEAAFLAYALKLKQNDQLSNELFASATGELDQNHLARFHRTKWRHFYTPLPITTFGYPKVPDANAAFDYVRDVLRYLPGDATVQFEAALLCYGMYNEAGDDTAQKRTAFELLGQALDRTEDAKAGLRDVNLFRATLLNGHRFLALGEKASDAGEQLLADNRQDAASEQFTTAEKQFEEAAKKYEAARSLHFKDLWKVHANVCNATLNSAAATLGYLRSNPTLAASARIDEQKKIDENLATAESSCKSAIASLPEDSTRWSPRYNLANVALKRQQIPEAAGGFVAAYAIAQKAGESAGFLDELRGEPDVRLLCKDRKFNKEFLSLCRSLPPPPEPSLDVESQLHVPSVQRTSLERR